MPKATTPVATVRQARRHNPLEYDLLATGPLRSKPSKRKAKHEDDNEDTFVDSKASRKILKIGQELADEDEESLAVRQSNPAFNFDSRFDDEEEGRVDYDDEEVWGEEAEVVEEIDIAPDDLETFNKFFPSQEDPLLSKGWDAAGQDPEEEQGTSLADLILEKIAAHEAAQAGGVSSAQGFSGAVDEAYELPPKVVEVYTK